MGNLIDREEVIKQLENDAIATDTGYVEVPLWLFSEILDLLKEREAGVMTLDELTEIYVEFIGDNHPIRLTNFDLQKIIMYMDDGICRLWKGKPTDEQRQAVKWE